MHCCHAQGSTDVHLEGPSLGLTRGRNISWAAESQGCAYKWLQQESRTIVCALWDCLRRKVSQHWSGNERTKSLTQVHACTGNTTTQISPLNHFRTVKLFSSTSCKDPECSTNTPASIQSFSTAIAMANFSLCLAKEWLDAKNPQSSLWGCAGHTPTPSLPPPPLPGENNVALSAPGVVSTSKGQWPFLS